MNEGTRPGRPQPGRVFDVRRPGRAPVSATSRPVIVSNKSEVQDPMMNRPLPVPSLSAVPSAPAITSEEQATLQGAPGAAPSSQPLSQPVAPVSRPPELTDAQPSLTPEPPELLEPLAAKTPVVADAANALHPPEEPLLLSHNPSADGRPMAHEDELPDLHELSPLPSDHQESAPGGKAIVSHHRRNWVSILLKTLGILLLLAILAAVIVDILMDGGFVVLKGVPHTHFF